ncbi:hypothetical protein [Novosphingobium sp.]|uniref:hypothetical protein n=2 Tax=unclassified Novosphingobium TaxID=2644732 RepID=UPI00262527ED|nr:hypothetical protein [Novosphingobium sp.]
MVRLADVSLHALKIEILQDLDSIWAIIRREKCGGVAMRIAQCPGGITAAQMAPERQGEAARIEVNGVIGTLFIVLRLYGDEVPVLRATTELTPAHSLLLPHLSRDLYPLDAKDDPLGAQGRVEAAQRGLNSGVCYARMTQPAFGSLLYFQNFIALNDWFCHTGSTPDGAVGGQWPELGYMPPCSSHRPLPAGKRITIYDALIAFHDDEEQDEAQMAGRYLTLLCAIYRHLEVPDATFHDWIDRAERSLHDLEHAPEASIRHYGYRYLHPYTAAEYPDSMVQMCVIGALAEYAAWRDAPVPLQAELEQGLRKFYDPKLKTLRRYLPNVGKDKNKNAVDSWYLYHPLKNLGLRALAGDKRADRLFRQSIDFAIRAAHHFEYKWPIQYDVTDFSVITEARDDTGLGQTDVGGMFAHAMLLAFALTDEKRFLEEARSAIRAAQGMRFELNYQANLTAWGAAACMRLWRIDNDPAFLAQASVYLASFFHNTAIWESQIGHARQYTNFLGVTALHDAPYMALYECFDSFAAFEQLLMDGGPDFDAGARMLVSEYCRYALDRAWYYYPDARRLKQLHQISGRTTATWTPDCRSRLRTFTLMGSAQARSVRKSMAAARPLCSPAVHFIALMAPRSCCFAIIS